MVRRNLDKKTIVIDRLLNVFLWYVYWICIFDNIVKLSLHNEQVFFLYESLSAQIFKFVLWFISNEELIVNSSVAVQEPALYLVKELHSN